MFRNKRKTLPEKLRFRRRQLPARFRGNIKNKIVLPSIQAQKLVDLLPTSRACAEQFLELPITAQSIFEYVVSKTLCSPNRQRSWTHSFSKFFSRHFHFKYYFPTLIRRKPRRGLRFVLAHFHSKPYAF